MCPRAVAHHLATLFLATLLACVGTLFAPGSRAIAQDEGNADFAQTALQAGHGAYKAREFDIAYRYFREAYELSGRAELLFEVGQSADRSQMGREALVAYLMFLRDTPQGAPKRRAAAARVRALEKRYGRIDESDLPPAIEAGGLEPEPAVGDEAPTVPTPEEAAAASELADRDDGDIEGMEPPKKKASAGLVVVAVAGGVGAAAAAVIVGVLFATASAYVDSDSGGTIFLPPGLP